MYATALFWFIWTLGLAVFAGALGGLGYICVDSRRRNNALVLCRTATMYAQAQRAKRQRATQPLGKPSGTGGPSIRMSAPKLSPRPATQDPLNNKKED